MDNSNYVLGILINILINFLLALEFCIFLAVMFSWFPNASRHPIARFVNSIARPVLHLAKFITPRTGMIDLSPIVAILGIILLRTLINQIAISFGL